MRPAAVNKLNLLKRMYRIVAVIRTASSNPGIHLLESWGDIEREVEQLEEQWGRTVDDFTAARIRRILDARAILRRG